MNPICNDRAAAGMRREKSLQMHTEDNRLMPLRVMGGTGCRECGAVYESGSTAGGWTLTAAAVAVYAALTLARDRRCRRLGLVVAPARSRRSRSRPSRPRAQSLAWSRTSIAAWRPFRRQTELTGKSMFDAAV